MMFLTTLQDIETFITSHEQAILLFMDELCIDCQRILPDLTVLEQELEPLPMRAVWRKDVPSLIKHYEVYGVPSILVYQHAQETARWVDRHPKSIVALQHFIQQNTE